MFEGSVKSIDRHTFEKFRHIKTIDFEAYHFRKLIHSQGIEWMRSINTDVYINNSIYIDYKTARAVRILAGFYTGWTMEDLLPDKDFCLWRNFPFNQLIYVFPWQMWTDRKSYVFDRPTCLYLWLNRRTKTLEARKMWPPCDYASLLGRCNKTVEFQQRASFIWSMYDTRLASKGVQIVLSVLSNLVYVFGIVTNSLLVYLIWSKRTRDPFKELKQYPYLGTISIFNILILFINIFSWICDCKNTLDLFCPEIRKFVGVQFFKVTNFNLYYPVIRK